MEAGQLGSTQKVGLFPWCFSLRSYLDKFKAKALDLAKKVKKIGEDDPRRIVHSFKVGLALTLVSIFYYVTPLFASLGVSAMWAVMTVVVVMEYTVGGTLSKGVNRTVATLVGGALGIGAHHIATLCGDKGEPIVLGIFVFLLAAMATYSRFIPEMKARYDYGVLVFILTFSLVTVSSDRVDKLMQLAHQRLSTIALGVAVCLFSSIFVFPVWAGEDLHHLVAAHLEKLASFLEGIGEEYFVEKMGIEAVENMSFLRDYESVLNSKAIEESMANFAQWEPGHGRFGFRHPWKQYLKIGALCRQCAYSMEVLQNFITSTKAKATTEPELGIKIRSACIDTSIDSSNILRELASEIHTMTVSSTTNAHIEAAVAATIKLKVALSEEARAIPAVLESAIAASLLADILQFVHLIAISTQELARLAHFKSLEPIHRATVKAVDGEGPGPGPEVVIVLEE